MRVGDIFYSVMQKDNNPFEKPRIVKFVVEKIFNENATHPIVATKTDKWGRHYCFKESQIYLTYKDAIPEKNEKIERIRQWEKDRAEIGKRITEEQRKREILERNAKAVNVLEKVKQFIFEHRTFDKECNVMTINVDDELKIDDNLLNYIDQKIKELKGE